MQSAKIRKVRIPATKNRERIYSAAIWIRTSAEEEKLFLDYESIKKKEKTLDDIDERTMEQIGLLLYHEMDWLSKNKPKQ